MDSTSPRRDAGFSLLELMIALLVLGLLTAQLFVSLNAQQQAFRSASRATDVQENARHILDAIAADVRNAGMLVPREVGISSSDGGANAPDRLCVSDSSIFAVPAAGTDPFWDNLDDRFAGAIVTTDGGTTLDLDTLDMDGAGSTTSNHFSMPSGVIIALPTGNRTHCAALTFVDPVNTLIRIDDAAPFGTLGAIVAPAVLYEIIQPGGGTQPFLQRNGIPLPNVEDLQVEFWVDSSGASPNGQAEAIEWPLHDLNSVAWLNTARIRRVRVSVMGIAEVPEESGAGESSAPYRYPGVANRAAEPVGDAFKRKSFTASILPRNLLIFDGAQYVPNVP